MRRASRQRRSTPTSVSYPYVAVPPDSKRRSTVRLLSSRATSTTRSRFRPRAGHTVSPGRSSRARRRSIEPAPSRPRHRALIGTDSAPRGGDVARGELDGEDITVGVTADEIAGGGRPGDLVAAIPLFAEAVADVDLGADGQPLPEHRAHEIDVDARSSRMRWSSAHSAQSSPPAGIRLRDQ